MNQVIFLGTGVSRALPNLVCVKWMTRDPGYDCEVCRDGMDAPKTSRNRRANVSILVQHNGKNILVDCGKTIREAALRWFPEYRVEGIDAVLLTHGHMDAMGGMDDLRGLERDSAIPIYLNESTETTCRSVYRYLFPREETLWQDVKRDVADLAWRRISNDERFEIHGLPVLPLPVFHGGDFISLGFAFGPDQSFVYISDVKAVPDSTMQTIEKLRPIRTLVVDALKRGGHPTHFSFEEAIEFVKLVQPEKAFFVGMTCSLGLHDEVQAELGALSDQVGIDIKLAWDGLVVPL